MADVYCVVSQSVTLSTPTQKMQLSQPLAYDNALAHSMRVIAYNDDGTDADLSGVGVSGSFLCSNGETVPIASGEIIENAAGAKNIAEVILPAACYRCPGRFKFTMNLSKDGSTRTVLWVEGIVEKNTSETIYDPGEPVSIADIIGQANAVASDAQAVTDALNQLQNLDATYVQKTEVASLADTKTYLSIP